MKTPLAKALLLRAGIDPRRNLPAYARSTFSSLFARREAAVPPRADSSESAPAVILFHDTWAEYNHPEVGQAAVEVLEAAGYRVGLAQGRACCGRPLITGGQADKVRSWVDHNVALLAPYARQGVPIVGLEPSCILTLRDEYPDLASDRDEALLLAESAFTFDEFIVRAAAAADEAVGPSRPSSFPIWRNDAGTAYLHGHCHQKALIGNEASIDALRAAGYTVELIDSGCCGMAGDFGYGSEHFEVSRAIGEERLFPAVRDLPADAILVASGTSCRDQIVQFTGKAPVHMAQALAAVLQDSPSH